MLLLLARSGSSIRLNRNTSSIVIVAIRALVGERKEVNMAFRRRRRMVRRRSLRRSFKRRVRKSVRPLRIGYRF